MEVKLYRWARKGLGGSKRGNHLGTWGKGIPGSGNSKYKSTEVERSLASCRNSKASVTGKG